MYAYIYEYEREREKERDTESYPLNSNDLILPKSLPNTSLSVELFPC